MSYFINVTSIFIAIALVGVYGGTPTYRSVFVDMTQGHRKIDCVDFYEQPAFSHPSLKQLVPKERQNYKNRTKVKFNEKEGCPSGMVPIASPNGAAIGPHLVPAQVHCYSVVRTKLEDGDRKFYGTNALEGLNKPTVEGGGQWSASRFKLWVESESVMAGWVVFPDYYKDNEAHLYVSFTAGATQCFNTDCPGFVQKSTHTPLGSKPSSYSAIGGTQYSWNISIELNKDDGSWHLYFTSEEFGKDEIGYWPGNLFQQLKIAAAQVEWGGEINDPANANPAPEMGSGELVSENEKYAGFFSQITVIDENAKHMSPLETEEFHDCPYLYSVRDAGDLLAPMHRTIYYGGRQTSDY